MIRRPPRSTQSRSSAASDVYKRQLQCSATGGMVAGHAQPPGTRRTKSWTGNGNVNGQRDVREALPCPFPAVCPCEALCAGFPRPVASVSLPAPETAVSRPVSRLCGEDCGTLESLGHRSYGGRKRCGIKEWRLAAPLRSTPARNADWGNENGKDYAFWSRFQRAAVAPLFQGWLRFRLLNWRKLLCQSQMRWL